MSCNATHTTALSAAGWMLAALLLGGCFFRTDLAHQPAGPSAVDDSPDKDANHSAKSPQAKTGDATAANETPAGTRALLLHGGWYRIPLTSDEAPADVNAANSFHYRHAGVEQLMSRRDKDRNELPGLLTDNDHLVASTAAVALARQGNPNVASRLIAAIEDEQIPLAARAAAIEALGQLPGNGQVETLGRLADEYGQYVPGASTGYQADLHAELLRALARHVDAGDDPRFTSAVEVPSSLVRIEALRAWGAGKRGVLPMTIVDLRSDEDPRVRAAAIATLAARKHADAFEHLSTALHDVDLSVRLAAIRGLGVLGDARSNAMLADMLKDRGELIRAAAVATIAVHGSQAVVLGATGDTSWRVRIEIAKALAGYCNPEGEAAARRMLNDASAEVERQVVRAVASWPPEAALPVLFDALARDAVTVRKLAADQIAMRWKGSTRFPYEASAARRAQALAELRERFQREYVRLSSLTANAGQAGKPDVRAPANDDELERLALLGDVAALNKLGPAVVGSLERLAVERQLTMPEAVYHDVLPRSSAVFAALDRMHGGTPDQRRHAVEDLVAQVKKEPAGRLAIARLCELMTTETDAPVWIRALEAAGDDGSEPAVRMARLALGQSSGEVRRRGCEYLAGHPDPAHELFLAPCLADPDKDVVEAAIRALGAAGQINDLGLLEKQLASRNEEIQLTAAVALVRLRDVAGSQAIERLSYSSDMNIRGHLARALGDLGDIRFTAILIRLLDDSKATVSHAALASLPRTVGHDAARSNDGSAVSTVEQIARWKTWYATMASRH